MSSDNSKIIRHTNISVIENFILSGSFTPIVLSKNLQSLRNLRIDYYSKMIEKVNLNNNLNGDIEDEYTNYCNFINSLIRSKKLPNAILSRILHKFLNDYEIVKPLDTEQICYNKTLDTLNNVSETLKNSNSVIKNKQISSINQLTQTFIKNNEPSDLPTK